MRRFFDVLMRTFQITGILRAFLIALVITSISAVTARSFRPPSEAQPAVVLAQLPGVAEVN